VAANVVDRILQTANVGTVECDMIAGKFKFAAQTLLANDVLVMSLDVDSETKKATCRVNCDDAMLASSILAQLKKSLRE
jgi:hypothetical protein